MDTPQTPADNIFVSFFCPGCQQEIEASRDMIGSDSECPACGMKLVIPKDSKPVTPATPSTPTTNQQPSEAQLAAMKSRTIRIELPTW